ncbi:hypothetical protein ACM25O_13345 [Sulfitobacter pontiacus]
MTIIQNEAARTILGVPGRAFNVVQWAGNGSAKNPRAIANQKWLSKSRPVDSDYWGPGLQIRAELRFDDQCRNGEQSFSITGEIFKPGRRDVEACGCIHDEIARYFPELRPLIAYHLTGQKGPMHYIANTVYHAGNRDSSGKIAGEPFGWQYALTFGDNPILHKLPAKFLAYLQSVGAPYDLEVLQLDHVARAGDRHEYAPKFTLGAYGEKWHEGPFNSQLDATAFLHALQNCDPRFTQYATRYGEGKTRDFDAARAAGVWPDATDEQLSVSKSELTRELEARLPALVARFREAMESACGFIWQAVPDAGEVK